MNSIKISFLFAIAGFSFVNQGFAAESFDPEKKLKDLGITLRVPEAPISNYVKAVRVGNVIYLAGHIPQKEDGTILSGKVGKDFSVEQARDAAKLVAINLLSTLKGEIGNLNKVVKIVKIFGMINCIDTFTEHAKVINGASDLLVAVFGEARGKHTRSAVGMASLPVGMPVEIEMIVEVMPIKEKSAKAK